MITITAFQTAENIDIRRLKKEYVGNPIYHTASELFYEFDDNSYLYVLSYGVVAFSGFDDVRMSSFINFLNPFCSNIILDKLREEFLVNDNAPQDQFGYNVLSVVKLNPEILRIVMLNVAQSVALDYYTSLAEELMTDTNRYIVEMEHSGKLKLRSKHLGKIIGRTLNVRNRIIDELYILDSPESTWEDEYLNKIDTGLKKVFDMRIRYLNIDAQLNIIKENLNLFKDMLHHRQSNILEWIIIALILIEVINLFFEKIG